LVLQQAAEAGNATAALELGATYDPIELEKLDARAPVASILPSLAVSVGNIEHKAVPDVAMARTWYQKAQELGSTEAAERLERLLAGRDGQQR
jgi:TPR repeat protein